MDQTVNFGRVSFKPKCKFLKHFSNCVCLIGDKLEYRTIFGGITAQETPKKGHLMDAESIQKILKIFNFTTTYAKLMKFTTNMYYIS